MKEFLSVLNAGLATTLIYIFGGLDVALQCLLVAIVIDYITGLIKSYKSASLNSKVGIKGLLKKVGILCLVALTVVIDKLTGNTGYVRSMVIYYLVANEGLSILENLGEVGIIVPEFLKKRLEQLKETESDKKEKK
ncbi:MAG: phage holin family protein [Bacilli bacterium]|nr:phage holin family protein [Bacilli bacterium]